MKKPLKYEVQGINSKVQCFHLQGYISLYLGVQSISLFSSWRSKEKLDETIPMSTQQRVLLTGWKMIELNAQPFQEEFEQFRPALIDPICSSHTHEYHVLYMWIQCIFVQALRFKRIRPICQLSFAWQRSPYPKGIWAELHPLRFSGCGSFGSRKKLHNQTFRESFCNLIQVHQNIVQVLKLTVVSKTDLRLRFTDFGVAQLL